jgi:Pro-kumamolisin, activation domain/Bacterial Ig-like domain (group 3)/Abnormal spindle-like microcephaly-assoc'd, ASPM-SPD-2-Hydin
MLLSFFVGILVDARTPAARPIMRPARLRKLAAIVALLLGVSPLVNGQDIAAPQRRINARIDDAQRTVLLGRRHPMATPSSDIGRVSEGEPMIAMAMHLKPTAKQNADLEELLAEQLDPKSINYHRWITAAQFGERFGADSADIAKIRAWLVSQGFAVLPATHSQTWIDFNGSTAQAEAAFRTEIHRYQAPDRTFYANASDPSVPAAFADMVGAINGLDNYMERRPPLKSVRGKSRITAEDSPTGVQPQLDYGSYELCAGDAQIIYDSQPLYALHPAIDGTGQKVATAGNYEVVADSFNAFRSFCGLPAQNVDIVAMPGTPSPLTGGAGVEALLDFEWIGALAPGAQTVYVYGSNVLSAFAYIVDNDMAPVVSLSWGTGGGFGNDIGQLANAQGITVMASSGDDGSSNAGVGPSDSPHVTSVGGTSFTGRGSTYWGSNRSNNSSALGYNPETAWSGSGGGPSGTYPKPSWQAGLGVPNDGVRDTPDVSLDADPQASAHIVCQSTPCLGTAEWIGGTSASSPVFAGIVALINQMAGSNGQGNINPILYALAASDPSAFHDITTGSNGYPAGIGYDMATGLGSVDVYNLVQAWPTGRQNGQAPTLDSISPNSVAAGSANFTLTVNGKGFPIDSQILWNGSPVGVTMQSGGSYGAQSATISSALLAAAATATITVSVPGWGTTDAQTFSVYQPAAVASLSFSPSSLTFSSQPLSTSSAPQSILVTNTGTQAVNLQSIAVAGSSSDFTQASSCSSSLAARSSCTITVIFQPAGVGERSARVVVTDTVSGSPQIVPLAGVGSGGILEFNSGQVSLVAGTYYWGFYGDGGAATSAQLQGPNQVWVDPAGNLDIADSHNFVVRQVGTSGVVSTIAGAQSAASGYSGNGGPATLAQLDYTQGVATDPNGNVYVSTWGGTVRAIDRHGIISTFAGDDTDGFSGDGGPAVNALISNQNAMALDAAGNIYLSDSSNNRIRKITSAGVISTVAGNGGGGYAGDGGPATSAHLASPCATAFDAAGNMYISDHNNNRIRMVSASGQISTFAGNGTAGFSGDGGLAMSAEINQPYGLAIDARGDLYFADGGNCRIRKVDTQGIITTVAGSGASCGTTHNPATSGDGGSSLSANFNQPRGLALDPAGNLIIGDYSDSVVRKISFAATPTLAFGTNLVGSKSAAQSVTISNLGSTAMHLSAIQFPAGYVQTSVGSDCSIGAAIAPGGQCNLGVAFAPVAIGTSAATITINDDAVGGTHSLQVTGTGTFQAQIIWPTPAAITYGTPIGAAQLNAKATPSGGQFFYSTPSPNPLGVRSYTLVVIYTPADTNYAGRTASVTLVVNKATPVISWAPAAMTYGSALGKNQLNITVSNPNSGAFVAGTFAYTPSLASLETAPLTVGAHTLSVNFTPTDSIDYASATKTVVITVNRTTSTTTLVTSNPSVGAGQEVTLTAAIVLPGGPGAGVPSGAVQFSDGATVIATANLNAYGHCSWSTTSLSAGTHLLTATYAGDQNFLGSQGSLTQRIGPAVSR